jgi:two-component system OmpR family sensor kinase
MKRAQSITVRLSLILLFLLLLMTVLGLESLRNLSDSNHVAAQIRDRWLPSTRALGDLNNFTTDFPAAEGAASRAQSAAERAAAQQQIDDLDHNIALAERAYQNISHDARESDLNARFESAWREYRQLATALQLANAAGLGDTDSDRAADTSAMAYDRASKILGVLTDRNVESARHAGDLADSAYRQARERILLAILLAVLLTAGATVHVTRSISAPLVDLAARMHRLASSEVDIEVVGTKRRDEIGEMARAVVVFRNNAVDLAQNRHALAQQAAVLQKKLEEEQQLTLLQRNFVSMVSHEFRTPLALIDGHAQRLISMQDRLTVLELAQRAGKVRDAVHRMTELIDSLIGSARLIDTRLDLSYRPELLDLLPIVREACQVQRELTPNVAIVETPESAPVQVHGDASLLSQLLDNLLSNAAKYSRAGGLIRVTIAREQSTVAVAVEDNGIGIPAQDRSRVFQRYYRGSNTSGIVGSGVGLHVVQAIAKLHHGTVDLHSVEGEGTRFTVRLPCFQRAPVGESDLCLSGEDHEDAHEQTLTACSMKKSATLESIGC